MSSWCTQYTQDLGHGSDTLKFATKGAEFAKMTKASFIAAKDDGKKSTETPVIF